MSLCWPGWPWYSASKGKQISPGSIGCEHVTNWVLCLEFLCCLLVKYRPTWLVLEGTITHSLPWASTPPCKLSLAPCQWGNSARLFTLAQERFLIESFKVIVCNITVGVLNILHVLKLIFTMALFQHMILQSAKFNIMILWQRCLFVNLKDYCIYLCYTVSADTVLIIEVIV
jgi:hypothetical protein